MKIIGYARESGEKTVDIELPELTTSCPGCFMHEGRHYRYYGFAPNKHIYLETPCEEIGRINGKSTANQDENGIG